MAFELTLQQMEIFFAVFAIGFIAARVKVVAREGLPYIAAIVTKVLLPAMIFYSTYANCTRDTILANWQMVLLAAVFYGVLSLVMFFMAKAMRLEHDKDRVFQFCFIFGNTGFVGVPLLAAVYPGSGLVYMMMFTIVDQAVFWTYGIWLSTARGADSARFSPRMLVTPNTIAIVLAVVFVMAQIPIPHLMLSCLGSVSSAAPGMCMLYLGALASFSNVAPVLKRPELYAGIAIKMIFLPVILGKLLILWGLVPVQMAQALATIAALPVMTVVPMIAASNGREGPYAMGITVVTLVASVATIPLVMFLVG